MALDIINQPTKPTWKTKNITASRKWKRIKLQQRTNIIHYVTNSYGYVINPSGAKHNNPNLSIINEKNSIIMSTTNSTTDLIIHSVCQSEMPATA